MSDTQRVLDFIMEVSKDPERLKAIAKDPDAEMSAAGLSQEEIEVLKSRDPERIRNLLSPGTNAAAAAFPTIVITAVIKF